MAEDGQHGLGHSATIHLQWFSVPETADATECSLNDGEKQLKRNMLREKKTDVISVDNILKFIVKFLLKSYSENHFYYGVLNLTKQLNN